MEIAQIEAMLPYTDCFQVGARNMQNFNLLRELGQVRKPMLLKRGIAATIEELLLSSEYIMSGGNYDVILCERGIAPMRPRRATPWTYRRFRWCTSCRICRWWAIPRMARGGAIWFRHGQGGCGGGRGCDFGGDASERQTRLLPTRRRR
jgi:hypothetical protein